MENTKNQLLPEVKNLLDSLNEAELIFLNNQIADRINLIRKNKKARVLSTFEIGDDVKFSHNNITLFGTIKRLNQKTATIKTEDNREWRCSPELLERIENVTKWKD